jgi:hypothetical protein
VGSVPKINEGRPNQQTDAVLLALPSTIRNTDTNIAKTYSSINEIRSSNVDNGATELLGSLNREVVVDHDLECVGILLGDDSTIVDCSRLNLIDEFATGEKIASAPFERSQKRRPTTQRPALGSSCVSIKTEKILNGNNVTKMRSIDSKLQNTTRKRK